MSADACGDCPAAVASRRAFLRGAASAVAAALAAGAVASPAFALVDSVMETRPSRLIGRRSVYPLPAGDSISVDAANDVILARWQDRVYAFSLKCPHRGARLEWRADERRVFCPKHKARFLPDGMHASGRRSRELDRHDIARQGSSVSVELDIVRRSDRDPDAWRAAVIVCP